MRSLHLGASALLLRATAEKHSSFASAKAGWAAQSLFTTNQTCSIARTLNAASPFHLALSAPNGHVGVATAFRQLKRTVLPPARIVRAWPKQPDFPF